MSKKTRLEGDEKGREKGREKRRGKSLTVASARGMAADEVMSGNSS